MPFFLCHRKTVGTKVHAFETKVHHFCQFSKAAGGQNGDFQTFLDFEKTRALWDLVIVFSKITH